MNNKSTPQTDTDRQFWYNLGAKECAGRVAVYCQAPLYDKEDSCPLRMS